MIRETIADALKSDKWTVKEAAEELDISADDLADFCSVKTNEFVAMLDATCEFLGLELMRVFTQESWDSYLEDAWGNWGSKVPSLSYAEGKAEEWDIYSSGVPSEGKTLSYDDWSSDYDKREFDAWEATALVEFERSERERLKQFSWVSWT